MIRASFHRSAPITATALLLGLSAAVVPARPRHALEFQDVTQQTGIGFKHADGSSGRRYIVEAMSAGLALFDYDQDGDIDIYLVSGSALRGSQYSPPPRNRLYRNEGNWRFTDVTETSGLGDTGHGLAVTVGDYDNDGDRDVYLTNFGPNALYRNNGDGTFTNVTKAAGVANGFNVGAGANFLDIEGDGDLDLFVSSYIHFTYDNHVLGKARGYPAYVGPRVYDLTPDALYRNNGDGTFTNISVASGIANTPGSGMGTVCADYDHDGDTDIFVANDNAPNFLFANNGAGLFTECGTLAGIAYDFYGNEMGSMGVDCADYDNDGHLDFYVTSYQDQLAHLYRNLGDGFFEDKTLSSGAGAGTGGNVTWGNGFADFDHDGDRDLFVAVGHLDDNVAQWDQRTSYAAHNLVLMNLGNGRFVDISQDCGEGLKVARSSRGCGLDDLDNDGDIDIVVLNTRSEPTILRNDSSSQGHWLQIRLRGTRTNRDGIGACVKVVAQDMSLIDEVHSGRGYQSHHGMRLHFGLGNRSKIDRVEVRWIGGEAEVFRNIEIDRLITLTEGDS